MSCTYRHLTSRWEDDQDPTLPAGSRENCTAAMLQAPRDEASEKVTLLFRVYISIPLRLFPVAFVSFIITALEHKISLALQIIG